MIYTLHSSFIAQGAKVASVSKAGNVSQNPKPFFSLVRKKKNHAKAQSRQSRCLPYSAYFAPLREKRITKICGIKWTSSADL